MIRAGHDALRRSANASWFEWLEGSAPFFWNWGVEYQRGLRDGQPHFITGPFPQFLQPQKGHKDPAKHELTDAGKGSAGSQTRIHTPRQGGGGDSLLLCRQGQGRHQDGLQQHQLWSEQCTLGPALWATNCQTNPQGLNQGDQECEDERGPGPFEHWERNWMGLRDSPYRSLQWQVRLKLEVYGDRKALDNPYHWDRVEFNLPGSKGYRSDLPWVMKIQCDGHLAANFFVYVDDGRATGHSPRLTWAAARAYAAGCSRRGVQDASRKRTSPSDTPGPWAGTVTHTAGGRVLGMVSQGKWDKTKLLIAELGDMIPKGPLPLQRLLEIRGFLMYVVWTYTWLNWYIKGLHLTVDSWRPGRAEDGFKWTAKERRRLQFHRMEEGGMPC